MFCQWDTAKRQRHQNAEVAELADAHGSGPCGSNTVRVQVSSSARLTQTFMVWVFCFIGIIAFALEYSTIFSLEKVSWQMILYEMCQLSCPVLTISCFFSGSSALSPAFFLPGAHDFLLFLWFVRFVSGFSSARCSRSPAFSLIRPLRLRLFFCPVLTISCFFSDSSALPPAFFLPDAHDFLLFLWFVRFVSGFSFARCSWFPAFSLVRPLHSEAKNTGRINDRYW